MKFSRNKISMHRNEISIHEKETFMRRSTFLAVAPNRNMSKCVFYTWQPVVEYHEKKFHARK